MSFRRTVIENDELKNFGSPIRPRRTRSTASRLISSKCSRYAIISLTPFSRQASIIRSALVGRDRHRLLAQHVHAGPGRADRVLGVHGVRQRDVDRVDLLEARVVLVVASRRRRCGTCFDSAFELAAVVADQRADARIAPGVGERRQHRHLRDVAQSDDGVADDAILTCRHQPTSHHLKRSKRCAEVRKSLR